MQRNAVLIYSILEGIDKHCRASSDVRSENTHVGPLDGNDKLRV